MERRKILKTVSLGTVLMALSNCNSSGSRVAKTLNGESNTTNGKLGKLRSDRKIAARRVRRIIMNNDGHDFNNLAPGEEVTPESMLAKRTVGLLGTHVDSIFYCTGVFNSYTHKSEESDLRTDDGKTDAVHFHELICQGTDSLEVMTSFCRQHGIEVFWSMRMNDKHEATRPYYTSLKWKKENPQCLMGRNGEESLRDATWRFMLDYGVDASREKVYRILADVADRYDVDGMELDFFRHPVYFLPQATGEEVKDEHRELMTGLIRRVRKMTEDVGTKRGRPLLIGIRVPDSVGYCRAMGLDLERWLTEDLVDLVVFGGYFKLEPWQNAAELGRRYGVPVYACLVSRRVLMGGEAETKTSAEGLGRWRGEALAAWRAGMNGIYTFNRFEPHDQLFNELGDSNLLADLERIDQTSYAAEKGFGDPGHWLQGGRKFIRHTSI